MDLAPYTTSQNGILGKVSGQCYAWSKGNNSKIQQVSVVDLDKAKNDEAEYNGLSFSSTSVFF